MNTEEPFHVDVIYGINGDHAQTEEKALEEAKEKLYMDAKNRASFIDSQVTGGNPDWSVELHLEVDLTAHDNPPSLEGLFSTAETITTE